MEETKVTFVDWIPSLILVVGILSIIFYAIIEDKNTQREILKRRLNICKICMAILFICLTFSSFKLIDLYVEGFANTFLFILLAFLYSIIYFGILSMYLSIFTIDEDKKIKYTISRSKFEKNTLQKFRDKFPQNIMGLGLSIFSLDIIALLILGGCVAVIVCLYNLVSGLFPLVIMAFCFIPFLGQALKAGGKV